MQHPNILCFDCFRFGRYIGFLLTVAKHGATRTTDNRATQKNMSLRCSGGNLDSSIYTTNSDNFFCKLKTQNPLLLPFSPFYKIGMYRKTWRSTIVVRCAAAASKRPLFTYVMTAASFWHASVPHQNTPCIRIAFRTLRFCVMFRCHVWGVRRCLSCSLGRSNYFKNITNEFRHTMPHLFSRQRRRVCACLGRLLVERPGQTRVGVGEIAYSMGVSKLNSGGSHLNTARVRSGRTLPNHVASGRGAIVR